MQNDEQFDGVVAVYGTPSKPLSPERVEVRTALFRLRQALDTLAHITKHTPGNADAEHDQIRADLEQAEKLLARWDPLQWRGRGGSPRSRR